MPRRGCVTLSAGSTGASCGCGRRCSPTSSCTRSNRARCASEASAGHTALEAGRWEEARSAFEASLAVGETPAACLGLAERAVVARRQPRQRRSTRTRAYALFRRDEDVEGAVQCAVWLAITYKANFANFSAANGWIGRAERLIEPRPPGVMHGWIHVARAYRMADLDGAEALTSQAIELARDAGDVDLELGALSQLGLIRVGQGHLAAGFALHRRGDGGGPGRGALQPGHGRLHVLRHAQRVRAGERHRAGRAVVPCRRRLRRQLRLPVPLRRVPHLLRERAGGHGKVGRGRPRADRRRGDHQGCLPGTARQGVDPPRRAAGAQGRLEDSEQLLSVGRGRRRGRGHALPRRPAARPRRRRRGEPQARATTAPARRAPHPSRRGARPA